jgi:multiple sugar transport system substrate-binding protein
MKLARTFRVAVIAALVAVACAPTATPSAAPSALAATAAADLRFTLWSGAEAHLRTFNDIATAYRQTHPNVTVKFDVIPFEDYISKLTLQLSGGSAPDAGWLVETSAPTFVGAGVLQDLGPTVKQAAGYDFADLSSSAMQLWQKGEAVYGVPFSNSPFFILYNRDLFESAGVETPTQLLAKGQWTWEAFARAAKGIVANSPKGTYGFESIDAGVFGSRVWHNLIPIIRGYGGDAWDSAGKRCLLNTSESVAAVKLFHGMVFTDRSTPAPGEQADFYSGKAAMTIAQLSRLTKLDSATFKWDIAPLPKGPAADAQIVGQAAIVAFNASRNKAAAAEFVAFLTNKENTAKLAAFFPPARTSVLTSDVMAKANPKVTPERLQQTVVQGIAKGTVLPAHAEFPKIDLAARGAFDKLWTANADVQAALNGVCSAIGPILAQ